ncbi:DUF1203 domain-containing protein [Sphingomonas arenae]|uniref:DUF1203 domain-containing protein n=1 Tax=Sphingomonas arenae TaxID=2812555 RepID=UPI0019680A1F|nr:DUF1203 domain-containing protein [Sphingomonas arenae]
MSYRIEGLAAQQFAHLYGLSEAELFSRGVLRVTADGPGFPCRITLEEAEPGTQLLLLNHVSQPLDTPFRSSHAIYVTEGAEEAASFVDEPPPVMRTRALSLRGFDYHGMLKACLLAMPGEADLRIRDMLKDQDVAEIHAHNAAAGCFSARIVRD